MKLQYPVKRVAYRWSLPSRECGLKFLSQAGIIKAPPSLPSRECGLKFRSLTILLIFYLSLPSRECGLKFIMGLASNAGRKVTPFAGVWIEILYRCHSWSRLHPSLPSRECGLKFFGDNFLPSLIQSLPSRECGLKSVVFDFKDVEQESLPSRECGLKSQMTNAFLKIFSHSLRGSVD